MRRSLLAASVSALALLGAIGGAPKPADAAPLAYINTPLDTPNSAANAVVTEYNAGNPAGAVVNTCSGNTSGTCTGTRFQMQVTNLTTAGNLVSSAQITVADAAVTAASEPFCQVHSYTGNGTPVVANITATAGNLTFYIQNTSNPAVALSATVPVDCLVYN